MLQYGSNEVVEEISKEIKEDKAFISFYQTLTPSKDLIRIFYRPSLKLYSVHGSEATFIAQEFHKNIKVLQFWDLNSSAPASKKQKLFNSHQDSKNEDLKFPYLGIREGHDIMELLEFILFQKQLRVEIWVSERGEWKLHNKGSPGNFETLMFADLLPEHGEARDASVVLSVRTKSGNKGSKLVGVAFCNIVLRTISVCEFVDNEQFSNLESIIVQVGVKECLYAKVQNTATNTKIDTLLAACNVPLNLRKGGEFKPTSIEQDLNRLAMKKEEVLSVLELSTAMEAAACLINYLELLSDDNNFEKFKITIFSLQPYMRLDSAAVTALNLFPSRGETSSRTTNVYGLLNKCKTAMGSRKLMQYLRQPLLDRNSILKRQDIVEALCSNVELRKDLEKSLKLYVPSDLDKIIKKIVSKRAQLKDCYYLYCFVIRLPEIYSSFANYDGPKSSIIQEVFTLPLEQLCQDFQNFKKMIESTLDLEAANSGEYIIKSDFDEALGKYTEAKNKLKVQIETHCEEVVDDLGLKRDKTLTLDRVDRIGWFFQLPKSKEKLIKGTKYHTIDQGKRNYIRFRSSKLEKLNEKFSKVLELYEQKSSNLINKILEITSTFLSPLETASELFSTLDVFLSFATVSVERSYVKPIILDPGEAIIFKDARHPCMEVQDDLCFISNDVNLMKDHSRFLIVTGPNMGGKSTYIRMIGILVLLSQIGCFVPAIEASVSIVDCILARVGASDSQLRGVSTFMAEMLEMSNMLRCATQNSLLIIDELGRGTSTYDGFGLAWALSQYICEKIGSFCLFATHFHELTELSKRISFVSNCHVDAQVIDGELVLLHKIVSGPSTQSYGIHIAEMANFPSSVVIMARKKANELEDFDSGNTTAFLENLQDTTSKMEIEEENRVNKFEEEEQRKSALLAQQHFLLEFSQLPLDKLSPEEGFARILQLKQKYYEIYQNNPLVNTHFQT